MYVYFQYYWCQDLPVQFGSQCDTVDAVFTSSHLWEHINRMHASNCIAERQGWRCLRFLRSNYRRKEADWFGRNETISDDKFVIQHTTDFDKVVELYISILTRTPAYLHDRAILVTTKNASFNWHVQWTYRCRPSREFRLTFQLWIIDKRRRKSSHVFCFTTILNLNETNVQGVPPHEL